MTAPELMDVHPTDETLAAFLDDRLDKKQRRTVIEHLAECGECRTFVNDVSEIKAMDEAEGNVVPMPKRGGGWRVAVASLAVAAGLVVVFGDRVREWAIGASVKDVTAVGATLKVRPGKGRLSVDLPYKKAKGVPRSGGEGSVALDETEVYGALSGLYTAKWPDPHARGLAHLLLAQYDEAISDLSEAAETNEDAKIDLAAALIGRGRKEDLEKALSLSRGNTREELWNRAAALSNLQRDEDAIKAWKAYLLVDPESEWAHEAREEIEHLEFLRDPAPTSPRQPAPTR